VEEPGSVSVEKINLPNPLDTSESYPVCGYTVTYRVQNSSLPPIAQHFGHIQGCNANPPNSVVIRYSRANPREFYVVSEKGDPNAAQPVGDILFLTIYGAPILGLVTFFTSRSAIRVCLGIGD
jgi:hypothetical protein